MSSKSIGARTRIPCSRRDAVDPRGFFILAGVAHLRVPDALLAITPGWVPFPGR